jgi:hypothetical protein
MLQIVEARLTDTVLNWDGREFKPGERELFARYRFLNAFADEELVGTIMFRVCRYGMQHSDDHIDLESVHVIETARGQGAFRALFAAMTEPTPELRISSGSWRNKQLQRFVIAYNEPRLVD